MNMRRGMVRIVLALAFVAVAGVVGKRALAPVPVPAVDDGPLEQLAALDHAVELPVRHEVVVDAVRLAGPTGPGRRRDRQPDLGVPGADVRGHRALPDGRRAGEDREPGPLAVRVRHLRRPLSLSGRSAR